MAHYDEGKAGKVEVPCHPTERASQTTKAPNGDTVEVHDCGVKAFGEFSYPAFADERDLPCGMKREREGE